MQHVVNSFLKIVILLFAENYTTNKKEIECFFVVETGLSDCHLTAFVSKVNVHLRRVFYSQSLQLITLNFYK